MFLAGTIAAIGIIFLLLKFNLKRVVKFDIALDVIITFFFVWIFLGTFSGMMAGLMAGAIVSVRRSPKLVAFAMEEIVQ